LHERRVPTNDTHKNGPAVGGDGAGTGDAVKAKTQRRATTHMERSSSLTSCAATSFFFTAALPPFAIVKLSVCCQTWMRKKTKTRLKHISLYLKPLNEPT
jgi:hypothetical protein